MIAYNHQQQIKLDDTWFYHNQEFECEFTPYYDIKEDQIFINVLALSNENKSYAKKFIYIEDPEINKTYPKMKERILNYNTFLEGLIEIYISTYEQFKNMNYLNNSMFILKT